MKKMLRSDDFKYPSFYSYFHALDKYRYKIIVNIKLLTKQRIFLTQYVHLHLTKKLILYIFISFREFKKILPSTLIYESILIKIV